VPAPAGFEAVRHRPVTAGCDGRPDTRIEALPRRPVILLLGGGEIRLIGWTRPGWRRAVHRKAKLRRERGPLVLVGRMQPAAAQIEREVARPIGPRAPTD